MRTKLIFVIIIINIFSIVLNWKMLHGFDNSKKIKYIIISELIMIAITFIVYQIGSIGMKENVINASRLFIVSTFSAVNSIVILSSILRTINMASCDEIKKDEFGKKITFYIIVAIIILVFECFYVKNIQNGILKMEK